MSTIAVEFDPVTHTYRAGLREFVSVSKVIRTMMPFKKSFDGVPEHIIENARERGIRVDAYCCEYARTGDILTKPDERKDVIDRVQMFADWWDKQETANVLTQHILSDDANSIAGTPDLIVTPYKTIIVKLLDIKCTAKEEADWRYQLGAYASMANPLCDVELAVIHIQKGGLKVRKYDTADCMARWSRLVAFWNDCKPWLKPVAADGDGEL